MANPWLIFAFLACLSLVFCDTGVFWVTAKIRTDTTAWLPSLYYVLNGLLCLFVCSPVCLSFVEVPLRKVRVKVLTIA